jgi:hypothetical protein
LRGQWRRQLLNAAIAAAATGAGNAAATVIEVAGVARVVAGPFLVASNEPPQADGNVAKVNDGPTRQCSSAHANSRNLPNGSHALKAVRSNHDPFIAVRTCKTGAAKRTGRVAINRDVVTRIEADRVSMR